LRARPIGIFDSGMGGLTVMRALIARLPQERFVYLGDTARLPYGTKSADTVVRAMRCRRHRALTERGVKLVVVACNTASAVALPALEAALAPTPVIGVIEPGRRRTCCGARGGPIAVIATEGTVKGERLCARHPCARAGDRGRAAGLSAFRTADGGRDR
jgi:glutamate racemase